MRVVILGSAEIKNYEKISRFINPEDFIIACDGGLNHVEKLGLSPSAVNLVVGDFDSHSRPSEQNFPSAEIIQLPCEKDDTDVFFAVKEALRRGFTDLVLIGVTIKNAKYPLENATIENSYQLGVSNEVLPGQQAEVSLKTGSLLLIQVW